jgi:hypothetical protein
MVQIMSSELVVIARFPSVADAQIAQGILEQQQLESVIRSDNAGGMYPALDGAALLVRAEDAAAAAEALGAQAAASEPTEFTRSGGE